ncbi:MAG TPA: CoA-binding protein, partial [Dehalococcoidia bacterium]|nr:CoA-binding protein [Dehalococcoidia bacterium]
VDYVQVNRKAEAVLPLLEECAAKGVKTVQLFTAGFSESGFPERAALEAEILERARQAGIRLIGPNCMGFVNTRAGVSYMRGMPQEPGPVGLICQSASISEHVVIFGSLRGLRFGVVFNQGNAVDINEAELMEYFARDPATELVGVYLEGVREGRRFFHALKEAATRKPVVIYKGGQTEAGGRAVYGHTASLAGTIEVFDGLCRQAGAVRARSLDEMLDVLVALRFMALDCMKVPQGPGVAALGIGGGASVRAADELEAGGLRLPPLPRETQEALWGLTPVPGNSLRNPIDAVTLLKPDYLREAIRIVAGAPGIDTVLFHLGFGPRWGPRGRGFHRPPLDETLAALTEARQLTDKPIVLAILPPWEPEALEELHSMQEGFWRAGFPVFHSLERAARAISYLLDWRARRD